MNPHNTASNTRSGQLFEKAFVLAMEGQHRDSDELLELAHSMRALELQLAEIAYNAPSELAVLMIKEVLSGLEELPPTEFVENNRDTLAFYNEHDVELRDLVSAVLKPSVYTPSVEQISEAELNNAKQELANRIEAEPSRRRIVDWTITTGFIAVQARGYRAVTTNGGCSMLRECPNCKNKYSTKIHRDRRLYWHCPHCNTIKEA